MSPIAARLDHFVRWFFNSSPTVVVEPRVFAPGSPDGTPPAPRQALAQKVAP